MDKSLAQPQLLTPHKNTLQMLRGLRAPLVFPQRIMAKALELLYGMRKFAFATKPKVK